MSFPTALVLWYFSEIDADKASDQLMQFSAIRAAICGAMDGEDGSRNWVDQTAIRAGALPPSYKGGDPFATDSDDAETQAKIEEINKRAAEAAQRRRSKRGRNPSASSD